MKYISIDLETTGLNAEEIRDEKTGELIAPACSILEFGAVLEDTNNIVPLDELPTYHTYIKSNRGNISGNIYALNLNAGIIEKLKNEKEYKDEFNYVNIEDLADDFLVWCKIQGLEIKEKYGKFSCTISVAGKNFAGFDRKFLDKVPGFSKKIRMRQRVIDPACFFTKWHEDEALPSLDECNKRIGHMIPVNHTAISDAVDVVRLLRTQYS